MLLLAAVTLVAGAALGKTVKGVVLDAGNDEPIIGASVLVKGTSVGASTDVDGRFTIEAPEHAKTLVVSYIGMTTREVAIKAGDMTIRLEPNMHGLDEVVVVAYGSQKKSSITGAITQVKSDELLKRPTSSVTAALEGATPGITVTGNFGNPGSSPTILIRGIGTVNGSTAPLYVIDGVPYGGNIADLNPEDIESLSVLKDAASAALYGNRASNGVILITTKKAKSERVQLTFKTNQGWYENGLPDYETVGIGDYMRAQFMSVANVGVAAGTKWEGQKLSYKNPEALRDYVGANIENTLYANYFNRPFEEMFNPDGTLVAGTALLPAVAEDTDWFDQASRKGYRQEYLFTGSGATAKSDYYVSLGYLSEDGYMKDSGFERLSGRVAVNLNPVKWVKTGVSVNVTHQNFDNAAADGGGTGTTNPIYITRNMAPIYPVHSHWVADTDAYDMYGNLLGNFKHGDYVMDGNAYKYDDAKYSYYDAEGMLQTVATRNQHIDHHVIWENELNKSTSWRNTMTAIAYADFILPYGFTATVKGNLSTRSSASKNYYSAELGNYKTVNGQMSRGLTTYKTWTFQQQLRWDHSFGRHTIGLLLGHEAYSYHYDTTSAVKTNQTVADLRALHNFSEMADVDGYDTGYKTESYLGRVQYNFDDRYNLEASMRRDGTSKFHPDTRWGTFGSVGANWIFKNEAFLKDVKWLNSGKLRADWGQVGNDGGTGYYGYMTLYSMLTQKSLPAVRYSQLGAEDLKWETGESWGIGLDARLFGRLNLTVEYFDKRNKDLIFDVKLPSSSGGVGSTKNPVVTKNIGSIANRGWELAADVDIYKSKDWKVNFGLNATTVSNKVLKLPEENKQQTIFPVDGSNTWPGLRSGNYKICEGKPRYEYYLYQWAGTDMVDGKTLYELDLVNNHIVLDDGTIIGGKYAVDEETGLPTTDLGSTELKGTEYRKINGKYYTTDTSYAREDWSGSSLPKVYGAFSLNVRYRNVSLSTMFTYSLGGKIYDSVYQSFMSTGTTAATFHKDVLNSWYGTPDNMLNEDGTPNYAYDGADRLNTHIEHAIDYVNNTKNHADSNHWLISRNYLCLKNVNLAWTLPKRWLTSLGINSVKLTFSAENVATWCKRKGMNPLYGVGGGQGNDLMPARVYSFGLNVNI